MAQYTTVSWQPGDEAVSSKLEQMAQNEEWLHDNAITGVVNYQLSAGGAPPAGHAAGMFTAQKVCGIRIDFDSISAVQQHIVNVNIVNLGFTQAPVVTTSMSVDNFMCVAHTEGDRVDYCNVRVQSRDGLTVRMRGQLHVILVGR